MNKHYILYNHYLGKPTIVIGEICCNGCQVFHKNEAKAVFDEFDVPFKQREDVYNLFDKYDPNEPFDFKSFVNDPVFRDPDIMDREDCNDMNLIDFISVVLEKYYTTELRDLVFNSPTVDFVAGGIKKYTKEQLDKLVNHMDSNIRYLVACLGFEDHMDVFVNDECLFVRNEVAKHGYHLDTLVEDPSWFVRLSVAEKGVKKHLDILVHDRCDDIRQIVADLGNKEHLEVLVDDWCYEICETAQQRLANM